MVRIIGGKGEGEDLFQLSKVPVPPTLALQYSQHGKLVQPSSRLFLAPLLAWLVKGSSRVNRTTNGNRPGTCK